MARKRSRNPIGFTPWPVTFFITASFIALFSSLITTHHLVPSAPADPMPYEGINITEAWHDLQVLTNGYHPYNSRRNDAVRNWLLLRIEAILKRNHAGVLSNSSVPRAVVYNDLQSNLTFGSDDSALGIAFTGTNIMVLIRGLDEFGRNKAGRLSTGQSVENAAGAVLVNAHFDSVPSGYGATDDGVGVVSILQLISYFTVPAHQPKRSIIALLNNGEEDYLNGAYAFTQHPLSKLPHTFLNLEGAGAGGRAVLFRSSDAQVTRFYQKAPSPFGTVISADAFKRKLVRSETDYAVFDGQLGMRGLDVAFMEPRSRYHTREDSTRYTSKDSLWHMLSGALATMKGLTSDDSSQFAAPSPGHPNNNASPGIWFDLYGQVFAVFEMHTFFAVSVTLLVVSPLLFVLLTILLVKLDKWYPFISSKRLDDATEPVRINGLRGFFRAPVAYIASIGALFGLVFLITKVNPYIVYSSEYSVWSMLLSAYFAVFWFIMRGADAMRPSALQRYYTLLWTYIGSWLLTAANTIGENNFHLAGGYFVVIYFALIIVALLISYLELLALPRKTDYAEMISDGDLPAPRTSRSRASRDDLRSSADEDATERTSLLRGDHSRTLGSIYSGRQRSNSATIDEATAYTALPRPYRKEQAWSGKLPTWTWLLQFILLAPLPVILVGQIALFATSALAKTPADGSSVLTVYVFFAVLTILLVAPISPFIHRFSYTLPTILFLVFAGTLCFNLLAFPFSDSSRLKVFFLQTLDLDTGINNVSLTGLAPYTQQIVQSIPSASGQRIDCDSPEYTARAGLKKCSWHGISPNVAPRNSSMLPPRFAYRDWVTFSASTTKNKTGQAKLHIKAKNTRACRLFFDKPLQSYVVKGFATDPRFPAIGKKGCTSIRLWSREWSGSWDVSVSWTGEGGLDGRVVCLWSDANDPKTIPAYQEVLDFMPRWSIVTKLSDGLVEGFKLFKV